MNIEEKVEGKDIKMTVEEWCKEMDKATVEFRALNEDKQNEANNSYRHIWHWWAGKNREGN